MEDSEDEDSAEEGGSRVAAEAYFKSKEEKVGAGPSGMRGVVAEGSTRIIRQILMAESSSGPGGC